MDPDKWRQQESPIGHGHKIRDIFLVGVIFFVIGIILGVGIMALFILSNGSSSSGISTLPDKGPMPSIIITPAASPTAIATNDNYSGLDMAGLSYGKLLTIVGSTDGELSDYQVRMIVHRGYGKDQGQDVYLSGHSLNWPYDIRFQDSADERLDYWIETYNPNYAIVWVKIRSIPANPATTKINIFYGNNSTPDGSSIENTFQLGDDFTGLDTGRWSVTENVTIENGTEIVLSTHTRTPDDSLTSLSSDFSGGYAIDIWLRCADDNAGFSIGFPFKDDDHMNMVHSYYSDGGVLGFTYDGGLRAGYKYGWDGTDVICSSKSKYHKYEMRISTSGNLVDYLVDDSDKGSVTSAIYKGAGSVMARPSGYGSTIYIDRIIVRKYTPHEPVSNAWTAEFSLIA